MKIISFVTGNQKKYEQVAHALAGVVEVKKISLSLEEPQIPSLEEISAGKVTQAFEQVDGPVLVDDSGIYFDAYNVFPGAMTKWLYQGVGLAGIQKLFQEGDSVRARFQCVLSYMDDQTVEPVQFVGEVLGRLVFDFVEEGGEHPDIPYDWIFQPDEMESIVAKDYTARNAGINHRMRATQKLRTWLENK